MYEAVDKTIPWFKKKTLATTGGFARVCTIHAVTIPTMNENSVTEGTETVALVRTTIRSKTECVLTIDGPRIPPPQPE